VLANPTVAVVDASVSVKWANPKESDFDKAMALLTDCKDGYLRLLPPAHWGFELAQGINKAIARGNISEKDGADALDALLSLGIDIDPAPPARQAFQDARRFQRSVYDSLYLTLAERKGCNFWTGDRRLFNAVSAKLKWVKWIGHYQPLPRPSCP